MKFLVVFYFTWVFTNVQASIPSSRLQRDSFPISYYLKLIPHIKNEKFDGEVTILIRTDKSIENITLNSKSLKIIEVTLDQAIGETKFHLDSDLQLLHVSYKDQRLVDPGEHLLHIKFRGSLQSGVGFYASSDYSNRSRKFLATKFSPTHAREAFPCYDEPYFKSIFNIRLFKPNESWTALSNMEEIGQVKTLKGIAVDFRSTIPMSTYLLAWFLVDFKYDAIIYDEPGRSIPLRFFTPKAEVSDLREALETTRKTLQFFENYTGIPYPLSKLDSIEVPHYRSGGMEHWGMIAYRDHTIMYSPTQYSSKLQHWMGATTLITHEVSHMWFGNLVSHEWYNDLWLTEGFARFMQFKAAFSIIGEPFMNLMFQNNKFTNLLDFQCRDELSVETAGHVESLLDIRMKFGTGTYDQGGAILLMLEDVIGKEYFQDAVRKHLNSHKYSYATTADFINTVQEVVPRTNIRDFMMTYLFQKNLPLIKVTENTEHFILHQEPLCDSTETSVFGSRWTVPINYITNGNGTHGKIWFDRDIDNVTIPKTANSSWIIVNHGYTGLFRTLYSKEIYNEMYKHFKELHIKDRGFLIGEMFHQTSYRNLLCDTPLQFIGEMQYIEEIDYLTFDYISRSFFDFTRSYIFDKEVEFILKTYFFNIFETLYQNVTWTVEENESIEHRLFRQTVLESFCENDVVYTGCYKDVEDIIKQNLTIHDDVKYIYNSVYKNLGKNETENENDENNLLNDSILLDRLNPIDEYEQNCSVWIRKNLNKYSDLATKSNSSISVT